MFDHSEFSFIIYDIDKDEAISIAKKFDQHSIFYNTGESMFITECDSKKDLLSYSYLIHFKGD